MMRPDSPEGNFNDHNCFSVNILKYKYLRYDSTGNESALPQDDGEKKKKKRSNGPPAHTPDCSTSASLRPSLFDGHGKLRF
jgi:hypothetical protein